MQHILIPGHSFLLQCPVRFLHSTKHTDWTRQKEGLKRQGKLFEMGPMLGLQIFQNAVDFIRNRIFLRKR